MKVQRYSDTPEMKESENSRDQVNWKENNKTVNDTHQNVKVNEIDTGPLKDLLLPKLKLNPDSQLQGHKKNHKPVTKTSKQQAEQVYSESASCLNHKPTASWAAIQRGQPTT